MSNTKILSVLLTVAAVTVPAVAAIPPAVEIRIGGADLLGKHHYLAVEGSMVSISVDAQPGDLIWLVASSIDAKGENDDTTVIMLMAEVREDGRLAGDFVVPDGYAGASFQLEAHARNAKGEVSSSTTIRVDIVREELLAAVTALEGA